MATLEPLQDGEWLQYTFFDKPKRVLSATDSINKSVEARELYITSDSIGWAVPDGNGGYYAGVVSRGPIESSSFSGDHGDGTSELASDASTEKLKWRGADGNGYEVRGDARRAETPSIASFEDKESGLQINVDGNAEDKHFLQQTFVFWVWRDENDLGYQDVQPPNDKWEKVGEENANASIVDTGATDDGTKDYYQVEHNVVDIDDTDLEAWSDVKGYSYDEPVTAPSDTPSNLSIGGGSTCDLLGSWDNTESNDIELELQYSSDAASWTSTGTIYTGTAGANDSTFSCYDATSGTYYRFRARYTNSAGTGDWSAWSDSYYFSGTSTN